MDTSAFEIGVRVLTVAGASVTAGGAVFRLAIDRYAPARAAVAGAVVGGAGHLVGREPWVGVALLVAALLLPRRSVPALAVALALGLAALLAGVPESHPATGGPYPWLGGAFAAVHVTAGGLWAGALVTLWVAARREAADPGRLGDRFGMLAAWAVGAAVLSGLALSFGMLGSLANLTRTDYGRLLSLKLLLLAGALALAAINRWRTVPAADRRALARNVAVETALALGVLGAAAWMAATPTPGG